MWSSIQALPGEESSCLFLLPTSGRYLCLLPSSSVPISSSKVHFSGPDRPWQPESPLYSFWPQLRWRHLPSPHPRALGLRKLQVHPELEETDFLAGTPSTQPVSIRPRELECGPGLRSSGVQLRPCILQAEESLQAVEGRYCWSRFAAPSLEHRGAVASRGQQRPKMPLLLRGKAKKVSGQGPHVKYLKIKKGEGGEGKEEREGGRRGRENRVESGVHEDLAGTLRWPSYPRPRGLFLKY